MKTSSQLIALVACVTAAVNAAPVPYEERPLDTSSLQKRSTTSIGREASEQIVLTRTEDDSVNPTIVQPKHVKRQAQPDELKDLPKDNGVKKDGTKIKVGPTENPGVSLKYGNRSNPASMPENGEDSADTLNNSKSVGRVDKLTDSSSADTKTKPAEENTRGSKLNPTLEEQLDMKQRHSGQKMDEDKFKVDSDRTVSFPDENVKMVGHSGSHGKMIWPGSKMDYSSQGSSSRKWWSSKSFGSSSMVTIPLAYLQWLQDMVYRAQEPRKMSHETKSRVHRLDTRSLEDALDIP